MALELYRIDDRLNPADHGKQPQPKSNGRYRGKQIGNTILPGSWGHCAHRGIVADDRRAALALAVSAHDRYTCVIVQAAPIFRLADFLATTWGGAVYA